jgi:hypothetical protein
MTTTTKTAKGSKAAKQSNGADATENHNLSKGQAALVAQFLSVRRRGVPLVGIATPDPAATMQAVNTALLEAVQKANSPETARLSWDIVRGLVSYNEAGKQVLSALEAQEEGTLEGTKRNSVRVLELAAKMPAGTVLYYLLASRWLADPSDGPHVIQAIWNLRELFKSDRRTLVLLSHDLTLPPELQGDVVLLDEPLPQGEELAAIIKQTHQNAGLSEPTAEVLARAVEAVQGLPAFAAEQVTAMSLSKAGLDQPALWERKRKMIEQTPGLAVYRGADTFASIGGVAQAKSYTRRVLNGRDRPNAIVWLDEIEKAMAGAKHDTSGVSQDYLGTLLSYMEDHKCYGMVFLGPPGAAKSAVAKAAGNEAGIPTIRLDLGGMKGSLVGQSEQQLRTALKVITSVSNDKSLWIATSNSVATLDTALLRRFPDVFYFDLPDRAEKDAIWQIWIGHYGLDQGQELPEDTGWVGANIQKACEKAWRLNATILEASTYIIPVGKSAAHEVEKLRAQADGKYLSASYAGVYLNSAANHAGSNSAGQLAGYQQAVSQGAQASGTRTLELE